mgnify:CR=1 FL=1
MRRLKQWIVEKYLPAWCRSELMDENRRLNAKIRSQAAEIDRLNAYIDGIHDAMHRQQKITVQGGVTHGLYERNSGCGQGS